MTKKSLIYLKNYCCLGRLPTVEERRLRPRQQAWCTRIEAEVWREERELALLDRLQPREPSPPPPAAPPVAVVPAPPRSLPPGRSARPTDAAFARRGR